MRYVGEFEVDLQNNEVRSANRPGPIVGYAGAILVALAQANGEMVSKRALCMRLWDDPNVDDNRLQVHISTLRKLLGPERDAIRTVPGRGYRLLATRDGQTRAGAMPSALSTHTVAASDAAGLGTERPSRREPAYPHAPGDLPARYTLSEQSQVLFGRGRTIAEISRLLQHTRLLTLVGIGGIGKSRLAKEISCQQAPFFRHNTVLVDLAGVETAYEVIVRIITACSVAFDDPLGAWSEAANAGELIAGGDISALHRYLNGKHILLVLDNSERTLPALACLMECVLARHRDIRFLVTSREPLHIAEEQLYRVPTLQLPHLAGTTEDALEATPALMQSPAVALFMSLALQDAPATAVDHRWLACAAQLCHRLDGLPLAIEIAAVHCRRVGIGALNEQLETLLFDLPLKRSDDLGWPLTLRSTLASTCTSLSAQQHRAVTALATSSDVLTFDDAHALLNDAPSDRVGTANMLVELIAKSLIVPGNVAGETHYRVLAPLRWLLREPMRMGSARHVASGAIDLGHGHAQVLLQKLNECTHL